MYVAMVRKTAEFDLPKNYMVVDDHQGEVIGDKLIICYDEDEEVPVHKLLWVWAAKTNFFKKFVMERAEFKESSLGKVTLEVDDGLSRSSGEPIRVSQEKINYLLSLWVGSNSN